MPYQGTGQSNAEFRLGIHGMTYLRGTSLQLITLLSAVGKPMAEM
jgi:hypothetical protein